MGQMHTGSDFSREGEVALFPMLCQSKESINEDVWRQYIQSQIGAIPDFAWDERTIVELYGIILSTKGLEDKLFPRLK